MVGSWEQKDAIRDRKSPPTHPLLLVALCCRLDLGGLSAVGPYPLLSSPKDPLDDDNDDDDDDGGDDDDDDCHWSCLCLAAAPPAAYTLLHKPPATPSSSSSWTSSPASSVS